MEYHSSGSLPLTSQPPTRPTTTLHSRALLQKSSSLPPTATEEENRRAMISPTAPLSSCVTGVSAGDLSRPTLSESRRPRTSSVRSGQRPTGDLLETCQVRATVQSCSPECYVVVFSYFRNYNPLISPPPTHAHIHTNNTCILSYVSTCMYMYV